MTKPFPWDAAMQFGFGVLHLSSDAFWKMTPRELAQAIIAVRGRAPAPMMRTRSRADSRPVPKRSASVTRSPAPNADSSSASAPRVSTSMCRLPPISASISPRCLLGMGKTPMS